MYTHEGLGEERAMMMFDPQPSQPSSTQKATAPSNGPSNFPTSYVPSTGPSNYPQQQPPTISAEYTTPMIDPTQQANGNGTPTWTMPKADANGTVVPWYRKSWPWIALVLLLGGGLIAAYAYRTREE